MSDGRVYKIWDKWQHKFWKTEQGKEVWTGVDTAMAAWNNERSPYCSSPVFSKQIRYELRAFTLHAVGRE